MSAVSLSSRSAPRDPFMERQLLYAKMFSLALTVAQCAGRALFSLGMMYAFLHLFPSFALPVALSLTAVGAPFLSAFFYQDEAFYSPSSSSGLQLDTLFYPPLSCDGIRGIPNLGANCWLNSVLQMFQTDNSMLNWLAQTPPVDENADAEQQALHDLRRGLNTFCTQYSDRTAYAVSSAPLR